jgi:hypothetical protein
MKKLFFFLLLLWITIPASIYAQKHEIRANLGMLTTADVSNLFGDFIIGTITIGGYTADNSTGFGAIGLEYWYLHSDRLKFGGLISYQAIDKEVFLAGSKTGDITDSYYTILPEVNYVYLQSTWVQLYAGAGLGLTVWEQKLKSTDPKLSQQKASNVMFNFHVNPIGFRLGNALGASFELGIGAKGIFNAGLDYRL